MWCETQRTTLMDTPILVIENVWENKCYQNYVIVWCCGGRNDYETFLAISFEPITNIES